MYLRDSSNSAYSQRKIALPERLVWTKSHTSGEERQILSNPVAIGSTVYVVSADGFLRAFEEQTGKEFWRLRLQDQFACNGLCANGSMLFYRFLITTVACSLNSPEVKWAKVTPQAPQAGPLTAASQRLFFGANNQNVYAVNDSNGEISWKSELVGGSSDKEPPCVVGNRLYQITSGMDHFTHVYSLDVKSGRSIWEKQTDLTDFHSNVAFNKNHLFYSSGSVLYSLEASDGRTLWSVSAGDQLTVRSLLVKSDAVVTASNKSDNSWQIGSYDLINGQPGSLHIIGSGLVTTPIIGSGNMAFFGTDTNEIQVVDVQRGTVVKTLRTGDGNPENLALDGDYLFVTTSDGRLLCFGP
jgi:outer membrane protein assembly factor BamB